MHRLAFDELKKELETVYKEIKEASNITFRFSRPDAVTHKNSLTFYLSYEGPLPVTSNKKEIKTDITISEMICYPPETVPILKCDEYTDLPDNAEILVYSLSEIAVEKTVALFDRARTEPRDLYDIWYLTDHTKSVTISNCMGAIRMKLEHRNKRLEDVRNEFSGKEPRLKKMWETRLSGQMTSLPEFDGVYRAVKRIYRQAGMVD